MHKINDVCNTEVECIITCASPKSGDIFRTCLECKSKGFNKYKQEIVCGKCGELKICFISDNVNKICN